MINKLKQIWKDESAQGATEYILMLVVVVSIAMMFREQITGIIRGKVSDLGGKIQSFE
jgi:Flp pilus assembly pilin Flp